MFYLYMFCVILKVFEIETLDIEKDVREYFANENFEAFQKQWQKDRKSYENAIKIAMQENYGFDGMNVYIRKSSDSQRISGGFYIKDDNAAVVLQDMFLGNLPHLVTPEVTFALASNVLRLESDLSKLFVHTQYIRFGQPDHINRPFIAKSPFMREREVHDKGQLAIVADDCKLSGYAIVSLDGQSVNLGHDTFTVSGCRFTFEISSFGIQSPPVIQPYENLRHVPTLEKLITKPLRQELIPKLQAAFLTYINSTVIFYENLLKYRQRQRKLFKHVSNCLTIVIRDVNIKSAQKKKSVLQLFPFSLKVTNTTMTDEAFSEISLKDLTLFGLDTLYSGHNGGPFKLDFLKIADDIRFSFIQVQGTYVFKNDSVNIEHPFFGQIHDVTFSLEINLDKHKISVDFVEWSNLEFSIDGFNGSAEERILADSIISGHLLDSIPFELQSHISMTILSVIGTGPNKNRYSDQLGNISKENEKEEQFKTKSHENSHKTNMRRKRKLNTG